MNDSQETLTDDEIDVKEYLNILLRRRKTFSITFSVIFAAVALYTFLMKPVYQATASFHVQNEKMTGGIIQDLLLSQEDPVETEMEIIQSRSNAEKVVRKVHLDWGISKASDGLDIRILDFSTQEKPSYDEELDYKIELTGKGGYKVWADDGIFGHGPLVGEGKTGQLMQGKGISLLLNVVQGKAGDSFRLALYNFGDTVEKFGKDLGVQEAGTNSDIVNISYPNTDPELARKVLDTLLQLYIAQNIGFKNAEGFKTEEFIDKQLDKVRKELDASAENLKDYKSSVHVVDLDAQGQQLIGMISAAETQRAGAELRKKQLGFAIVALKDAMRSGKVYSPSVLQDDPLVAGLAGKLADLETQKRGLLSQYTENHPDVRAVEEQIGELQKKILDTYETALKNVSKNEAGVTQLLNSYEGKMSQLPETERKLAKLVRDEKVGADTYTFLLQQGEQARIAAASTLGNIAIIDPAETAEKPIKPKPVLYLLGGFIFALMSGTTLAFIAEFIDDTIKDADTAKKVFGAPLLAVIPYLYGGDGKRGNGKKVLEPSRERSLIVHSEPKSQAAETFRSLRTAVHFAATSRKQQQVFTITSTFPSEGKSTVSANLATIIAQTGSRTIVIDCDLRRPSLHEIFGCDKVPGISDVLAGDRDIDEVIRNTGVAGLDFVSAGTIPPNPAELIGSEPMTRLIESLSERYDRVIIDAPPVLAVTDAPLLTAATNMVLLVAAVGKVPAKAAMRVREVLDNVGASVIGVVMNDQTMSGGKGYGYGGYGYGYHYYHYYGEKDPSEKEKKPWWKRLLKKQ